MTKEVIKEIFRNIVRTWPDTGCSRPNTFFIIDDGTEFETENLKATYRDYERGDFWSRDWVLSGAHPDELRKQYPIVGIEQKRVSGEDMFVRSVCYEYWVVIVDQPDCPDCPEECQRTKDEVDSDLFANAVILLQELKNYKLYSVNKDSVIMDMWLTPEQVSYMLSEGIITEANEQCRDIRLNIQSSPLDIRSTSLGLTDGARAVSFSISFCDCPVYKPDFDYSFVAPAEKGTTKCSTCP